MNTPAPLRWFLARDVEYQSGLEWQRVTAEATRGGLAAAETLALVEHAPVYTVGQRGGLASLRVAREALRAPLVEVERGGDVTWHGPGQLVGYPILDLRAGGIRAADYVRRLELLLIAVLEGYGAEAGAVRGRPGVWTAEGKIAAIGVAIRGGVSMHGFALNVSPDLGWFDAIVPCGIADADVTSMERVLGTAPGFGDVASAVQSAFAARFEVSMRRVDVPVGLSVVPA